MRLQPKEYKKIRRLCAEVERTIGHLRGYDPEYTEDGLVHALNPVMSMLELERLRLIKRQSTTIPANKDNPKRLV